MTEPDPTPATPRPDHRRLSLAVGCLGALLLLGIYGAWFYGLQQVSPNSGLVGQVVYDLVEGKGQQNLSSLTTEALMAELTASMALSDVHRELSRETEPLYAPLLDGVEQGWRLLEAARRVEGAPPIVHPDQASGAYQLRWEHAGLQAEGALTVAGRMGLDGKTKPGFQLELILTDHPELTVVPALAKQHSAERLAALDARAAPFDQLPDPCPDEQLTTLREALTPPALEPFLRGRWDRVLEPRAGDAPWAPDVVSVDDPAEVTTPAGTFPCRRVRLEGRQTLHLAGSTLTADPLLVEAWLDTAQCVPIRVRIDDGAGFTLELVRVPIPPAVPADEDD